MNDSHDGEVLANILEGIDAEIAQVSADGAYDQLHCYDEIAQHGAKAVIPPRKDAKIWQHGNTKVPPHPRDQNLRYIRKHGRKKWKHDSGYHRRSLAETTLLNWIAESRIQQLEEMITAMNRIVESIYGLE